MWPMLIISGFGIVSGSLVCTGVASGQLQHSEPPTNVPTSVALAEFLKRFDQLEARGFVRSLRAGSTGIGYTLEHHLGVSENNSPAGDLPGLEIKAYRDSETAFDDRHKMNLFLKEPRWKDDFSTMALRISRYGYQKQSGQFALYQSVTCEQNDRGWSIEVRRPEACVALCRNHATVAVWDFKTLARRLHEKHSETVFVAAVVEQVDGVEHFHYRTVTYCADPDLDRFLKLMESGDVIVELRMHIKPSGSARNHGTAFRLKKHRLKDLYRVQRTVRPQ